MKAFERKPIPRPSVSNNAPSEYSSVSANEVGRTDNVKLNHDENGILNTNNRHHDDNGENLEVPTEDGRNDSEQQAIERHLSLIDLIAIGVGGTIGSGLFVLVGLVSHQYAGPSAVFSWCLSGVAACLSGCCYAELSARIPLPGGAYAYTYTAMGQFPALLTATCLSMNYISASAAVARSWGDKCIQWLIEEVGGDHWIHGIFKPYKSLSPLAFLISSGAVIMLLNGVKESKRVTNFFTALKASVSIFMVVVGLYYTKPSNWDPFLPKQFGVPGIMRGATATFFGYLGYDSVCSMGGEALNPKRNLPIAILLTLVGVSILYITATLALTGMQEFQEISPVSGFPHAFYSLDANLAGQITAAGELATLPIVVLISIMAEPRLLLAMSEDGLVSPYFRQVDENGNLWNGTFVAGTIMVLISSFVPFEHLNDMISFAVLSVLNMTDTSLILLWHEGPVTNPRLSVYLMLAYHISALTTAHMCTQILGSFEGFLVTLSSTLCVLSIPFILYLRCPRSSKFGGRRHPAPLEGEVNISGDDGYFRTPFVPFWPCIGIFINWYLIAQLELKGVISMLALLLLASFYYVVYTTSTRIRSLEWSQVTPGPVEMTDISKNSVEVGQQSKSSL